MSKYPVDSNQLLDLEQVYAEGYSKGNAGMNVSYCPQNYLFDPQLKSMWLHGWQAGRRSAGLGGPNYKAWALFSVGIMVILIGVVSVVFFNSKGSIRDLVAGQITPEVSEIATTNTTAARPSDELNNDSDGLVSNRILYVEDVRPPEQRGVSQSDVMESVFAQRQKEQLVQEDKGSQQKLLEPVVSGVEKAAIEVETESADLVEPESVDLNKHLKNVRFTYVVENREPGEAVEIITTTQTVYFYTNVVRYAQNVVSHKWYLNDQLISKRAFRIGGPRWRVHSAHTFSVGDIGEVRVEVSDNQGNHAVFNATVGVSDPLELAPESAVDASTDEEEPISSTPANEQPIEVTPVGDSEQLGDSTASATEEDQATAGNADSTIKTQVSDIDDSENTNEINETEESANEEDASVQDEESSSPFLQLFNAGEVN